MLKCVDIVDFFSVFEYRIKIFDIIVDWNCVMKFEMNFMFLFFLGYNIIIFKIVLCEM